MLQPNSSEYYLFLSVHQQIILILNKELNWLDNNISSCFDLSQIFIYYILWQYAILCEIVTIYQLSHAVFIGNNRLHKRSQMFFSCRCQMGRVGVTTKVISRGRLASAKDYVCHLGSRERYQWARASTR